MDIEKQPSEEPMETDALSEKMEVTSVDEDLIIKEAIAFAENINQKLQTLTLENAQMFMQNLERNILLLPKEKIQDVDNNSPVQNSDMSEFVIVNSNFENDAIAENDTTILKDNLRFETKTTVSLFGASSNQTPVVDEIDASKNLPFYELQRQPDIEPAPFDFSSQDHTTSFETPHTQAQGNQASPEENYQSHKTVENQIPSPEQGNKNSEIYEQNGEEYTVALVSNTKSADYTFTPSTYKDYQLPQFCNAKVVETPSAKTNFKVQSQPSTKYIVNTMKQTCTETEVRPIINDEKKMKYPKQHKRSKSGHSAVRNHDNKEDPKVNQYCRRDDYLKRNEIKPVTDHKKVGERLLNQSNQLIQHNEVSKPPPKALSLQPVQTQVANVTENDWLQGTQTLQQGIKTRNNKSINILILGQTGVGKSTWINAFANYLTYETLEDAINAEAPICVIPTKFSIFDDEYQRHEVLLGNHSNEVFSTEGQSATQNAKTYMFQKGDLDIFLIDTPGMDDTRGNEQDDENVQKILRTIAPFKEIHAICFLFKANEARLSQSFRYCIGKLLGNLSKSALRNICFVFTNARGTFYKPGDTMAPLRTYFKTLEAKENLTVKINDDNIFCLDNEAFRFICAHFSRVQFGQKEMKTYGDSWKHSAKEVNRLLLHASRIQPHITSETLSINDTKTWIIQLINPIINVSNVIQMNLQQLHDRINELEALENNIELLQQKACMPITSIETTPLDKPQTVCASSKCVKYEKIGETLQPIYKTVCHKDCTIERSMSDPLKTPDPALESCIAFLNNHKHCTGRCKECGCGIEKHLRIFYVQKVVTNFAETEAIKSTLTSQTDASKIKQKMIKQSDKMINEYRQEFKYLITAMVKFSLFLFQNGISQSDIFEKHIEKAVESEEKTIKSVPFYDDRKYCQLGDLLMSYRHVRDKIFNDTTSNRPSLEDIQKIRQQLFAMPLTGTKIGEMFDIHVEADHHDHANEITFVEPKSFVGKAVNYFKNLGKALLGRST